MLCECDPIINPLALPIHAVKHCLRTDFWVILSVCVCMCVCLITYSEADFNKIQLFETKCQRQTHTEK